MDPEYTEGDDRGFGIRVMAMAFLGSIPVWGGLLTALWMKCEPVGYLVALAVTLPIPLAILGFAFRWTKCPACGQRIRVPWRSKEHLRGGMLRYTCESCRIVWRTHLYPGSDVS